MQMIRRIAKIDTANAMTVAFDVSKDTLNYYSEVEGKIAGTNFPYRLRRYSKVITVGDEIKDTIARW